MVFFTGIRPDRKDQDVITYDHINAIAYDYEYVIKISSFLSFYSWRNDSVTKTHTFEHMNVLIKYPVVRQLHVTQVKEL